MGDNRYTLAGWLAIIHAILLPLAIGVGIFEELIGYAKFRAHAPQFGVSDILSTISVVLIVYVLVVFRKLLNERYNYHEVDTLITISIWCAILFTLGGIVIQSVIGLLWPVPELVVVLTFVPFFAIATITIGIVDIIMGVKLLRAKDKLNDLIVAFAYISLVAGLLEVTVVLSPLSLILVPVLSVVMGMILLREKEAVEFV